MNRSGSFHQRKDKSSSQEFLFYFLKMPLTLSAEVRSSSLKTCRSSFVECPFPLTLCPSSDRHWRHTIQQSAISYTFTLISDNIFLNRSGQRRQKRLKLLFVLQIKGFSFAIFNFGT
ncbi:hypothetical protein D8B26_002860 [Coccidioides posadasii str. Silveira]|uniref:uncharacterized protein n=1 Tax=Coccidioides posadasii (strain RMSCC 757 / Silveira) TaxID=443226 RepID=UPI001BEE2F59|nr:hypothetical protein D8B26_002860 [Coccidioides posadasii str. Silveira]